MDGQVQNFDDSKVLNEIATYLKRSYILQRFQALGEDAILNIMHRDIPIKFYLPDATSDFIQGRILEHEQFFEHRLLMKIPPGLVRDRVCIDAGANIGNHTIFFSKILGARKVISIEPQHHVFNILKRNVELNNIQNSDCRNAALGASGSRVAIATGTYRNLGAVTFRQDSEGAYPVISIDELDVPEVGLMKIDVEGMQMQVLNGAKETLKSRTRAIMIELRPELNEVEEATAFLKSYGFQSKPIGRTDFLFTK